MLSVKEQRKISSQPTCSSNVFFWQLDKKISTPSILTPVLKMHEHRQKALAVEKPNKLPTNKNCSVNKRKKGGAFELPSIEASD